MKQLESTPTHSDTADHVVRLDLELYAVVTNLHGIRVLADSLAKGQFATQADESDARDAIPMLIDCICDRLKILARVLNGHVDPASIISRANHSYVEELADGATALHPWPIDQKIRNLKFNLKRLKREKIDLTGDVHGK